MKEMLFVCGARQEDRESGLAHLPEPVALFGVVRFHRVDRAAGLARRLGAPSLGSAIVAGRARSAVAPTRSAIRSATFCFPSTSLSA